MSFFSSGRTPPARRPRAASGAIDALAWRRLGRWFGGAAGRRCAVSERRLMRALLPSLYGLSLVYLGPPALAAALGDSPVSQRWCFQIGNAAAGGDVADCRVEALRLPLPHDSVDVIVVGHLLECAIDARPLLTEMRRVLKPNGRLLVTGFSTLAPWGLARAFCEHERRWRGLDAAPPRVVAALRGRLIEQHFSLSETQTRRFRVGRGPLWGASYALVAQKRVIPPTLVRPQWRPLRVPALGARLAAEARTRVDRG